MLAYGCAGAESGDRCEPVDLITGPGNIWVTAAKRLLRGVVGIDAEAGPTEIAILADDTADPVHVAADLISQAEHDPLAASVLVTAVAGAGRRGRARSWPARSRPPSTPSGSPTALTGQQSGAVLVDDLEPGCGWSTRTPPSTWRSRPATPASWPTRVRNAGAVFVGPYAPVSLGDYCAGSNHVLPTGGCARHSSGLSVQSFLRGIHVVEYDEAALREVAGHVVTLAERRGPAGARPGRPTAPVPRSDDVTTLDDLPLRDDLRGRDAVRRAAARRAGAAEHQRELLPAAGAGGRGDRQGAAGRAAPTSTATRTATRWRCAPTWPATSGTG